MGRWSLKRLMYTVMTLSCAPKEFLLLKERSKHLVGSIIPRTVSSFSILHAEKRGPDILKLHKTQTVECWYVLWHWSEFDPF